MKKYLVIKILFFCLLSSIFCHLSSSTVHASSVTVFPSIISLVLSPGKTSTTILTIGNNSESPLPVRVRFEPLLLTDDATTLPSIGSWITLSKSSLLIPSQKKEQIEIKITLPKTIPLGGYYGMLFVEPLSSTQSKTSSLIQTKMGVLLLGSIGVQGIPLSSIAIQKPILNTFISDSKTRTLSYAVKNNSLTHISAKPYLIVHPYNGKAESILLDERIVFPGTTRKWESDFTVAEGNKGYYEADLFVSIGNGKYQKQSFSFIIFPIQQAIILVLCIAVVITIKKRSKQINEAIDILIKG